MENLNLPILDANSGFSSFSFSLDNCALHTDVDSFEGVKINIHYNAYGDLICSHVFDSNTNLKLIAINATYVRVVNVRKNLDSKFLLTSRNMAELRMVPRQASLQLSSMSESDVVTALLINGPDVLISEQLSVFKYKGVKIKLTETGASRRAKQDKSNHKNSTVITHEVELIKIDSSQISNEDACQALNHFRRFLTFVRGGYVGLGHIIGYKDGKTSFAQFGFQNSDQYKLPPNWFDISLSKDLSNVYEKYIDLLSNEKDIFPILRALEFYRAASTIQNSSCEVALVSSYAALETIIPHVLISRARRSKRSLERVPFSVLLRQAVEFIKIITDPYEHLPEFKASAQYHSERTDETMDAYDTLALYRNRMTHPKKQFEYDFEVYEALNFSQWLIEIFIFYFLRHDGEMQDRRNRTGWKGSTTKIPIEY